MILNIILIIVIAISLAVVIYIVARKVPYLKTLDVDTVPEEQAARVRDRILLERLKRAGVKIGEFRDQHVSPLFSVFKAAKRKVINRIYALERKFEKEESQTKVLIGRELENKIKAMLDEAEDLVKQEKYNEAEKRLIEIISLDVQNVLAYERLYDIYLATKEYKQALQTAQFLLKLALKKNKQKLGHRQQVASNVLRVADVYINLGDVNKLMGQNDEAFENYQKALEVEPNSPKNLDKNLEMSIILKQKSLAADLLTRLEQVNPQNQKLREYGDRIAALG